MEREIKIENIEDLKHILRNDIVEVEGLLKHMDKAVKIYHTLIEEEEE